MSTVNRRALATLLVAVALVLAGCGGVAGPDSAPPETTDTSTPEPTETSPAAATGTTPRSTPPPTDADAKVHVDGSLRVDAARTWERVDALSGGGYTPPRVSVRESGPSSATQLSPFHRHLGMSEGAEAFDGANGAYIQQRVTMYPANDSPKHVERILAHEYAHAVHDQAGLLERIRAADRPRVGRVVFEGAATFVEDAYTRRYLGYSALERRCERYAEGTPYERYVLAPYCLGARYFDDRVDSPAALTDPDRRLPNTTAAILHPGRSESPAPLSVAVETGGDWRVVGPVDREGELFVRTVLGTELPEQQAREAAAGWGNDRLVSVVDGAGDEPDGYVWVLRWDGAADADEFETAFEAYLDARGERDGGGWRVDGAAYQLVAVDDRTAAVVTGDAAVVDAASVDGGDRVAVVID